MTTFALSTRAWLRAFGLVFVLPLLPLFAADASGPGDVAPIVSSTPMRFTAEDAGVHGQLVVAPEVLNSDTPAELFFTITSEPLHGRVGLAGGGGDEADFFKTKTSRLGYFAYQPDDDYEGEDSFAYSVRNEANGLVFENTVVIQVQAPPPVVMQKFEVDASRMRLANVRPVALTTRPNQPVTHKLPSHEDFMPPNDRVTLSPPKVVYRLDDQARPQNGSAKLDPATGQLTYAPNPGFIGEEKFKYYTLDENNPQLGVENLVTVSVQPIRHPKHIAVDRSRSREVDLVFVINNSRSMAAHQARIAANLRRFRQLFDAHDLDYRIGVLTTDFINAEPGVARSRQHFYEEVRSIQFDTSGQPVLDSRGRPKSTYKRVATNGNLVTLPVMPEPWVTRQTPDPVFAELVKVGTNGNSNRTAFTAVYNFVANYYNHEHAFLRPDATTFVVFFMDEEETRMALWKPLKDGARQATWIEDGKLPDLLKDYNARHPRTPQTLDGYINYWVLRPFIIAKGNKRGKLEIEAVVSPNNISHRRAAELTGGSVLNIDSDFSAPLAALGDRIANTVAVALEPVEPGATLYKKSIRVLVDGDEVKEDPQNGWVYDERSNSIRFQGEAKKKAFLAKIDIRYEEHL